jgi:hypothetical protein
VGAIERGHGDGACRQEDDEGLRHFDGAGERDASVAPDDGDAVNHDCAEKAGRSRYDERPPDQASRFRRQTRLPLAAFDGGVRTVSLKSK